MRKNNGMIYPKIPNEKVKEKYICSKCRKQLTPKEAFFRVDPNNYAIINNAPPYCKECYNVAKFLTFS